MTPLIQFSKSYPAEAVSALLKNLNISSVPNAKIVELGSGTGLFTELIAAREEKYKILAVEPHEGMRGELIKKFGGSESSNVKAVDGSAENIPVDEEWGDGVIASQSFHVCPTRKQNSYKSERRSTRMIFLGVFHLSEPQMGIY